MTWTARDETAACAGRSALVLAPHPDDETLGAGATILRKVAAGSAVTVAVLTDGRHSHRSAHLTPEALAALRRGEMAEAGARLGLPPDAVRWGGFVDGTLAAHEDAVHGMVRDLVAELRPDEVYATCADESHPDHATLGRVARRVTERTSTRLLEYPVWLWNSWPLRRGDRAGSALSVLGRMAGRRATKVSSAGYVEAKLHALSAHASQLGRPDGVPAEEPWPGLPGYLLSAAADRAELFFV